MENFSGPSVSVWSVVCLWNEFSTKNAQVYNNIIISTQVPSGSSTLYIATN